MIMARLPIDTPQRKIGSKAVAILHYKIDADHWEFRQETGNDVGRDCTLELSENNEWPNHKIEGQIKGTEKIEPLKKCTLISFPMEVKTINYALSSHCPFALFYVDVTLEKIFYLAIQDYFIDNPDLFAKLETQDTINIHIPMNNLLNDGDDNLVDLAKCVYIGGPGKSLKKYKP